MFFTSVRQEFCPQGVGGVSGQTPLPQQMATAADGTHPTGMRFCPIVKNSAYFAFFMTSDNNAVLSEEDDILSVEFKGECHYMNQNFLNFITFQKIKKYA